MIDDETRSAFSFCAGKVLCPDGSCRTSRFDCPELTCPFEAPYRCPDGLCVVSAADCPERLQDGRSADCPTYSPFLCADGSCASTAESCPLILFCPAPYIRCPNGFCVLSWTQCPVQFPSMSIAASYAPQHPLLSFLPLDEIASFLTAQWNLGRAPPETKQVAFTESRRRKGRSVESASRPPPSKVSTTDFRAGDSTASVTVWKR